MKTSVVGSYSKESSRFDQHDSSDSNSIFQLYSVNDYKWQWSPAHLTPFLHTVGTLAAKRSGLVGTERTLNLHSASCVISLSTHLIFSVTWLVLLVVNIANRGEIIDLSSRHEGLSLHFLYYDWLLCHSFILFFLGSRLAGDLFKQFHSQCSNLVFDEGQSKLIESGIELKRIMITLSEVDPSFLSDIYLVLYDFRPILYLFSISTVE